MLDLAIFANVVDDGGDDRFSGSWGRPARRVDMVAPGSEPGGPSGLPLPEVGPAPGDGTPVVCAVSPMGAKGRISDAFCLRELGWAPGTVVEVLAVTGVVTVTCGGVGDSGSPGCVRSQRVDPSGHLRLLAVARRIAGFRTGERLLLLADPERQVLRILSTAVLHRLVTAPAGCRGLAAS